MKKNALITGITGQDGSYLAELLLEEGYRVFGLDLEVSEHRTACISHILDDIELIQGDMLDGDSLAKAMKASQPREVYNLAAMSFVPDHKEQPLLMGELNALGVTRVLEAVRAAGPKVRFFQAGSSEMFGNVTQSPQNESTPFYPRNPYGAAKAYGHYMTRYYRESLGVFACSGILFNHESPRRSANFVTRKVTRAAAAIKLGIEEKIELGDLSSRRDWGFAGDYVKAMWLMLQQDAPDDYVIATGEQHTVRDLCETAFQHAGLDWKDHVIVSPSLVRSAEKGRLVGDPARAGEKLGWTHRTSFEELIKMMVDNDLALLQDQAGS